MDLLPISENFQNTQTENICSCEQIERMRHIYICTNLNIESEKIAYEKIFDIAHTAYLHVAVPLYNWIIQYEQYVISSFKRLKTHVLGSGHLPVR